MNRLPLAIAIGCTVATTVVANPNLHNAPSFTKNTMALLTAQSGGNTLSDSDLRRLNHYSSRSLQKLASLGESPNAAALALFRTDINRLIDAGSRSGLSQQQTADYFKEYVATNAAFQLPANLLDSAGHLKTRDLFQTVAAIAELSNSAEIDVAAINSADLAALQSMTNQTPIPVAPVTVLAERTPLAEPEPAIEQLQPPEILADTDPVTRAILERVQLLDNKWVIEVVVGDSLAQYAAAVYGDRLQYSKIYDANRNVLRSPNILSLGLLLTLPHEI